MRRLAIFSFAFALAALCAGYLPLDGALIPLGIASAALAALTWIPLEGQKRPGGRCAGRRRVSLGFLWTAGVFSPVLAARLGPGRHHHPASRAPWP